MALFYGILGDTLRYLRNRLRKVGVRRSDAISPLSMLALSVFGVVSIYAAQSFGEGTQWRAQLTWLLLGAVLYAVVALIDYSVWLKNAHWFYGIAILCLLALWSPLGRIHFGARRWLDVGLLTFQPSDVAKIGVLFGAASVLARTTVKNAVDAWAVLLRVGLVVLPPMVLIFLQPDLGSSMVIVPMVFALLCMANFPHRFFVATLVMVVLAIIAVGVDVYGYHKFLQNNHLNALKDQGAYESHAWLPLKDYQRNRILTFVAPEVIDPQGRGVGWNRKQSLISVGTGGFWGKGIANGTQAKLGYLPQSVASNDFIFSVLTEEMGFVGGALVLFLYAILVMNGVRIAGLARDKFGALLAVGISAIFVTHIFVNIGMTIGVMPITGIPLPFISYGGSFVLICCVLQGIVQSIYRFRYQTS